ncbi:hypothetical protein BLNAU_8622 [Blattamonas nauphoetae]|uniref:Uncharacterized protein n=1 Tax=Blattamonas nauphoetae TaxID=2049346 RepID=A0ABQ9XY50_9EUKA|nr:hypothetical protein BLNAU_8622 [Blattamonas nauphoetae]
MEPSCPQPSPAPCDFSLDDFLRLMEKLEGCDPENGETNIQLDKDRKRLAEMLHRLQHDQAKHDQIFQQMNEIIQQIQRETAKLRRETSELKERTRRLDEENKQRERKRMDERNTNINKCIEDSQSHTVTLIKSILRKFSPNWIARLNDPNRTFSLLADGHVFFSKNWHRNHTQILSTPLLFRPLYNPILHHILKFIFQYFPPGTAKVPPGTTKVPPDTVFYITGDQGIGKTSLMLILMSALSECGIEYYYRKWTDGGKATEFISKVDNGDVIFVELETKQYAKLPLIRIFDDNLPIRVPPPGTLSIIFTSPDQNRMNIAADSSIVRYFFRLPTFSLAEAAVAMVGCTPTVPLSLLSPEDMELRKDEQQILFFIEKEKEEIARLLPSETRHTKKSSEQQSASELIKDLAKSPIPMLSDWDVFVENVVSRLLSHESLNKDHRPILREFLINLAKSKGTTQTNSSQKGDIAESEEEEKSDGAGCSSPLTQSGPSQKKEASTSKKVASPSLSEVGTSDPSDTDSSSQSDASQKEDTTTAEESTWKQLVKTLTDDLTSKDHSESTDDEHAENTEGPNFSDMSDTPESIVQHIGLFLGPQGFDTFHMSLYRSILDSRDLATDKERDDKIVSDWISHLEITSGRDKTQTPIVTQAQIAKELLTKLMLAKTNDYFELALANLPPPPDIQAEILNFSVSINQSLETDSESQDSLQAQLVSLKQHINEKDTDDFKIRQELRKKVETIKLGITSDEGEATENEDKARDNLFDTLIHILTDPPSYDSHQDILQTLFVVPELIDGTSDVLLQNKLDYLLAPSSEEEDPNEDLKFIVEELLESLVYSQTKTPRQGPVPSSWGIDKQKMAQIACDLLTMIVDLQHEEVETRLESVKKEIEDVRNRLSFVMLMDNFDVVARNMNILVTPHSILKGLSERAKEPPPQLNIEQIKVFRRNLRDIGLSEWVAEATETLLELIDPPETDCVKDHEEPATWEMQLEERVVDTVTPFIQKNVNGVIKEFFAAHENGHHPVDNPKWLAIVRSMMNTLLFLIDAGISRHEIVSRCDRLGELLEAVYEAHKTHLRSVAEYTMHRADLDDDENAANYVNDSNIFSTHFSAMGDKTQEGKDSEETKPDFDVESLRTLEFPRTLRMNTLSQNRLERMSIALFARNLLLFLQADHLPVDDQCYTKQFFIEFLRDRNPEDVVHRSFVDFMNATGLLSQLNFGLEMKDFHQILQKGLRTMKSVTATLRKTWRSGHLVLTMSQPIGNPEVVEPFEPFLTRPNGVYLLLWASTELLRTAAGAPPKSGTEKKDSSQNDARTPQESETEQTVRSLNVSRASIFGPSPRWLTSTDVRTNRGLSFLWNGVLRSEDSFVLTKLADSNHSRLMSFNTPHILFKGALNAAWGDMIALVPVLPNFTKEKERPANLRDAFSLIFKKSQAAIKKMKSQISFVAISPFVEQVMQSELISAIAQLPTQERYEQFRQVQATKYLNILPTCLEESLVYITFLLNYPTPIRFSTTATSFDRTLVQNKDRHFWKFKPILITTSSMASSMPMLVFPQITNRSVHGTPFLRTLSETKPGKTDFYVQDLRKGKGEQWPVINSLIVSRGKGTASETIFMPIQATPPTEHSLLPSEISLIQQLLFQAMSHLEVSEGLVALYNHATTQQNPTFPSPTEILGFHMVSSHLKFEKNTLKDLSSKLRHRDRPLVTTRTEPHSTMTTRDILDSLLSDLGQYQISSDEFDPWKTTLPAINNPTDPYLILPFRWKSFYNVFWASSLAKKIACVANPTNITNEEIQTKNWLDRMVRRTMQELNRIGINPNDLGESRTDRIVAFSSFLLSIAISCRRNDILHSPQLSVPDTNDARLVGLVESMVGTDESETLKILLASLSGQTPDSPQIHRDERLRNLDNLYRQPSVETILRTVYSIVSNHAMKRIRVRKMEECSEFQHKTTCLQFCTAEQFSWTTSLPSQTSSPLKQWNMISHFSLLLLSLHTKQQLNFPLLLPHTLVPHQIHHLVRRHFEFLCIRSFWQNTDQLNEEVTNVTPATLSQWHPRRVVIDPSFFPQHAQTESLSLFTSFIHRLFDNTFIPVTTSFSTEIPDLPLDETFLLSQIRKIEVILTSIDLKNKPQFIKNLVSKLSSIQTSEQISVIFSLLPTIHSSLQQFHLSTDQNRAILRAIESIEANQPHPTLVFVKSGSAFLTSTNTSSVDVVDTTESRPFPIPFSTGYKETDLRTEMKDVFEPLTRLLPDHFPTGRPSLMSVDNEGKQELRKTTSSEDEAKDRVRAIMNSVILRTGDTSRTPLFVFVVDEDLADNQSLPMSLRSSDDRVRCGMMRQRSLADVLWILFLSRLSREVIALPFNTSVNSADFSYSVIPFLSNALVDVKLLKHRFSSYSVPTVLNTLICQRANRRLNHPNRISSVGLDLLVSAFPHLKDETQILLLSHLLMVYPSGRKGRSRLDALVNHPSPEIGLVALIRWFQLLSSIAKKTTLQDAIKSRGFSLAKVETFMLRAFYLIIEHDGPDDLITQLCDAIGQIITLEGEPLFFKTSHTQDLQELIPLALIFTKSVDKDSVRGKHLQNVIWWINRYLK